MVFNYVFESRKVLRKSAEKKKNKRDLNLFCRVGCVGLACVEASRLAGAAAVLAVDRCSSKEAAARKFGATHFLCTSDCQNEKIQNKIFEIFQGGVDFSFDCTGNVGIMRAALECTKKGWGVSVILGVAGQGEEIRTRPFNLIVGRQWRGAAFGGWQSRSDMPKLVDLHMSNKIE
ncbi:Alcohol dehydrogenase class-3, related [Eimeria tenella]|uniref:Alcohol dehydrogenase class-3, related n=1 Tax=Eimeria tenella TaxID=5802 RepID=U6L3J5_EIMTE|nr:Alcohol dehydrogenase class-3, related [Eimeria tenella]CDJ43778.1 Alcohol dehydrogenase class-3, related [Eimeria tenella]|eukprot:XP_013234527.1 Alcohol dehydrogenase class-3, related [Eimeria tenella]